jgi:ABC-type uncharacterized transport system permease subunit
MLKNLKKAFLISLYASVLGGIQIYWFLPEGLSCLDLKSSAVDAIFNFVPIQFIIITIIFMLTKKRMRFYSIIIIIIIIICFFWFFVNKYEFTHRHACWSTFSESSILLSTFIKSLKPIITCLVIFIVGYLLLGKLKKRTQTGEKTI